MCGVGCWVVLGVVLVWWLLWLVVVLCGVVLVLDCEVVVLAASLFVEWLAVVRWLAVLAVSVS